MGSCACGLLGVWHVKLSDNRFGWGRVGRGAARSALILGGPRTASRGVPAYSGPFPDCETVSSCLPSFSINGRDACSHGLLPRKGDRGQTTAGCTWVRVEIGSESGVPERAGFRPTLKSKPIPTHFCVNRCTLGILSLNHLRDLLRRSPIAPWSGRYVPASKKDH